MCPRTVRNFWLSARIEGRKSRLVGGPRGKDGGMSLTLYQRSEGSVAPALEILCSSRSDGALLVEVVPLLPLEIRTKCPVLRIKTRR